MNYWSCRGLTLPLQYQKAAKVRLGYSSNNFENPRKLVLFNGVPVRSTKHEAGLQRPDGTQILIFRSFITSLMQPSFANSGN